jgi:hypothetical protein
MLIQWKDDSYWNPSKADMRLKISYQSIYYCNSTKNLQIKDSHVFKKQDVWTFYITERSLKVWLNGKEAFYGPKDSRSDSISCPLWNTDLEIIETLTGPVQAIRSYDSDDSEEVGE